VFVILRSSSRRLPQTAPSPSPLLSAPSANSALKSPRSHTSQLSRPIKQPNSFPLFPHPVNMAHTQTPANPSPSIVYFTLLCIPGKIDVAAPISPNSHPMPLPSPALRPPATPLNATLTENKGVGISKRRAISSEPSARNNAGPSLPVFPFDFKLSTVDLFSSTPPLTSPATLKSRSSNTYKKQGGPAKPHVAALLATPYSPPTTHSPHHSATLCFRGTP
jgi:hypothetical protein